MSQKLPIDDLRQSCEQHFASGSTLLVCATTGSGKSTRLPLWASGQRRVLVVQPRRIACVALADYLAQQTQSKGGQTVGYAIRGDHNYSSSSQIVFVTPGVALGWFADDRLAEFASIILDEFHERGWDTDLLLALLLQNAKHQLTITSATLEKQRLQHYLSCQALEAQGRQFPVEVSYLAEQPQQMPSSDRLAQRVLEALTSLGSIAGDVLVFLPGRAEIEACRAALKQQPQPVFALYSGVDRQLQRQVLSNSDSARIILSTNVAETSLTIPGVVAVIDSGLERRTEQRNGRTVLSLVAISKASAEQRRGRAGRLQVGRCLRLYGEFAPLLASTPPQLLREELDELLLCCAAAGTSVESLNWLDSPPQKSLQLARGRLEKIAALDGQGRLTKHGERLQKLPLDSLFSHLIASMPSAPLQTLMAYLAAGLSLGNRWYKRPQSAVERSELAQWLGRDCDLLLLLHLLSGQCHETLCCDKELLEQAQQLARQITELLALPAELPENWQSLREPLLQAIAKASPELCYVQRQRRQQAYGNGFSELALGRDSYLDDSCEALLVLDQFSLPGRGTRQTLNIATVVAPLSFKSLANWQLGDWQRLEATLEDEQLQITEALVYAGRELARKTRPADAHTSCAVLAAWLLEGRVRKGVGERITADIEAWNLFVAMGMAEPSDRPVADAELWLADWLYQLGIESWQDLALLEDGDIQFEGIPDWQREKFDLQFPRRISTGDMQLAVSYTLASKTVVLEKLIGLRKTDPKRAELPRWPGWKINFKKASRVVIIK